jgi:hypothetical protein
MEPMRLNREVLFKTFRNISPAIGSVHSQSGIRNVADTNITIVYKNAAHDDFSNPAVLAYTLEGTEGDQDPHKGRNTKFIEPTRELTRRTTMRGINT